MIIVIMITLSKLCILVLAVAVVLSHDCCSLTNLDYRMSKTKNAIASITGNLGYHGESSAAINVFKNGSSKSFTINFEEPEPLEDIDLLEFYVLPASLDGEIEVELHLDGDGDGEYHSTDPGDSKLISSRGSWRSDDWSAGWNRIDILSLAQEIKSKDRDKQAKSVSWSDCLDRLGGAKIVKMYIRLINPLAKEQGSSCYVDYIKIGDEVISFEPLETEEIKRAKSSAYSPGSTITYIITYGNNLDVYSDVVVTESYDSRTIFIEAYPPPDSGTSNIWTIHNLAPGEHGQIVVKLKTSKGLCEAEGDEKVSGAGYVSVRRRISTEKEGYQVSNTVRISGGGLNASASERTAIKQVPGFTIEFDEHGSGTYRSVGTLSYSSYNVGMDREVKADWSPFVFELPRRNLSYNSSWQAERSIENGKLSTLMRERYLYAGLMCLNSSSWMNNRRSSLETIARINGTADFMSRWSGEYTYSRYAGNFTIKTREEALKRS